MNKLNQFIYGFLTCYFFLTITVKIKESFSDTPQVYSDYRDPRNVNTDLKNAFAYLQTKNLMVYSTPSVSDIAEDGDFAVVQPTVNVLNVFSKIGNDRYYVPLTRLP